MSDEETRAAAFRADFKARRLNDAARVRRLAGSSTARNQLLERWRPFVLARQEALMPDQGVDFPLEDSTWKPVP